MKYRLNEKKVLLSKIGEDGVLFDLEKNVYMGINETFLAIVEALESGMTDREVAEHLASSYHIEESECFPEVKEVIKALKQKDFLIEEND